MHLSVVFYTSKCFALDEISLDEFMSVSKHNFYGVFFS